jgi:hypothetical protein
MAFCQTGKTSISAKLASQSTVAAMDGLGRYEHAVTAAQRATSFTGDLGTSSWALVELIEAATRSGMAETAVGALARLTEMTSASGTDWALGIEARSRALLSDGPAAEILYQESITRLARTRLRPDLARAHLLFGEWLRRALRRGGARTSCVPLTPCSMPSAWTHSPAVPAASCALPGTPPGDCPLVPGPRPALVTT